MGESPPVCREHFHTGRPHTRIDNRVFKKSNVMSSMKKKKNLKLEKNQYLSNKHKYTVSKRSFEKKFSYFDYSEYFK